MKELIERLAKLKDEADAICKLADELGFETETIGSAYAIGANIQEITGAIMLQAFNQGMMTFKDQEPGK